MKKILALILILALCASLVMFTVSCGDNNTPSGEGSGEGSGSGGTGGAHGGQGIGTHELAHDDGIGSVVELLEEGAHGDGDQEEQTFQYILDHSCYVPPSEFRQTEACCIQLRGNGCCHTAKPHTAYYFIKNKKASS
mgnify:CR=1 FL=1